MLRLPLCDDTTTSLLQRPRMPAPKNDDGREHEPSLRRRLATSDKAGATDAAHPASAARTARLSLSRQQPVDEVETGVGRHRQTDGARKQGSDARSHHRSRSSSSSSNDGGGGGGGDDDDGEGDVDESGDGVVVVAPGVDVGGDHAEFVVRPPPLKMPSMSAPKGASDYVDGNVAAATLAACDASSAGSSRKGSSTSIGSASTPQTPSSGHFSAVATGDAGFHAHDALTAPLADAMRVGSVLVAMHGFHNRRDAQEGDLEFQKGERITLLDKTSPHWWKGRHERTGRVGMFPAAFCRPLPVGLLRAGGGMHGCVALCYALLFRVFLSLSLSLSLSLCLSLSLSLLCLSAHVSSFLLPLGFFFF